MQTLAESLGLTEKSSTFSDADALDELDAIEVEPTITIKELFVKMLETKAYRRSVYRRLVSGTLPPAVECKIYDHAIGKPIDRIEIEDKTENYDALSLEELRERQQRTVDAMKKILTAQALESNSTTH